ncbi:major capsid protein, partial [Vibrio crassostreae]|uniref:major capsid protein n=1 Tax=Vibrio crassostreae TaxID=246167 RepID=UPI003D3659D3
MSNLQTGAARLPPALSPLGFLAGPLGRLLPLSPPPVLAGASFALAAVGALRLSPLRRGLALASPVAIFPFSVPPRPVSGAPWLPFLPAGVPAPPLPPVPPPGSLAPAAFLGPLPPAPPPIPPPLFPGSLPLSPPSFPAPWLPARPAAPPPALPPDAARSGFRCCPLPPLWPAPLPPAPALSRPLPPSPPSLALLGLPAASAPLPPAPARASFLPRSPAVLSSFGCPTSSAAA